MKTIEQQRAMTHAKWIAWIRRNEKARKRYHMKRYGNLDRMNSAEDARQELADEQCIEQEIKDNTI